VIGGWSGYWGDWGGVQAVGCAMAPSLVMTPPSEVAQPSARLPEAAPRGRALFLFGPNTRGTELPLELPLWGVPEEYAERMGLSMVVLSEVMQIWVGDLRRG
jgi:hypothetical protein